jgi:SAM-dependent methyltransferase
MWDQRYAVPDYLFGTDPADFLRAEAHRLPPSSRVLCVADGEGRNSVHLAALGHRVTAMDGSTVAIEKARALAARRGVSVDFHHADIEHWPWQLDAFDAVVAIFIQFADPAFRTAIHRGIAQTLRPGGLLLMHGYAPRQVGYGTGGPPDAENMYTLPQLLQDFAGWPVLHAADRDAVIQEGRGHSGNSALVDFIAFRPALAEAATFR